MVIIKFFQSAILVLLLTGCFSFAEAQPGGDPILRIEVVDSSGRPIREASIKPVVSGFIRNAFPTATERNFQPLFRPIDGERSTFLATIRCGSGYEYAFQVSSPGYDAVTTRNSLKPPCFETVRVVLKPNGQPLPQYERLAALSGRLTNNFGAAVTYGLHIFEGQYEFIPQIATDGRYSIKLKPGIYRILFQPYNGCTEYELRNYPIDRDDKVLDLKTECSLPPNGR